MSFWSTLTQPIIGLSPMDGVTDHPFRHITKKYGNPAIVYTEFTSVEGVCHGASQLLKDFLFDETQRPAIAQVYGTTPDFFRQTAIILCQLGFDGIDINMGCPAKNVAHSGAGAALIKTPKLAQEIIGATRQGIQEWQNGATCDDCANIRQDIRKEVRHRAAGLPAEYQLPREIPISIKTRIGFDQPVLQEWMSTLLEMEPAAIALHGRTLKQQYGGLANWEAIGQAAQLVRKTNTLILGNGDIKDIEQAVTYTKTYNTHGALIGRASFGNPFVFRSKESWPDFSRYLQVALEHAQLFENTFSKDDKYSFLPMRKHMGWYIHDVPRASEIRQAIYRCNSAADCQTVLTEFGYLPDQLDTKTMASQ